MAPRMRLAKVFVNANPESENTPIDTRTKVAPIMLRLASSGHALLTCRPSTKAAGGKNNTLAQTSANVGSIAFIGFLWDKAKSD